MNVTNFASSDLGRRLYEEIALVEEEHVTQYEDLMDSSSTWLEMLLWHEYNECYLYWSNYTTETDRYIKRLWEENFAMEVSHLHKAAELLRKYEGKEWQEVIKNGRISRTAFPARKYRLCAFRTGQYRTIHLRGRGLSPRARFARRRRVLPLSGRRQSPSRYRACAPHHQRIYPPAAEKIIAIRWRLIPFPSFGTDGRTIPPWGGYPTRRAAAILPATNSGKIRACPLKKASGSCSGTEKKRRRGEIFGKRRKGK